MVDSSGQNHTVNVNGDPARSSAQSKFGGYSILFGGTDSDNIQIPQNSDFAYGTGDFTIDFWFNLETIKDQNTFIDGRDSLVAEPYTFSFFGSGSGFFPDEFSWYDGTHNVTSGGVPTINVDTWYHVAIVKNSGTTDIYINGTSYASWSDSINYTQDGPVYIGAGRDSGTAVDGYIDELRISKGVARWTSNFTPPSAAY